MNVIADLVAASPLYLPIVSALGGVLAGGLLSRSNEKNRRLSELRREVILESLDCAHSLEGAMNDFIANAPHGSADEEADSLAAEALDQASELKREMRRVRGRVAVVAPQSVISAFEIFDNAISDYMDEVERQIDEDGVFRVREAQKFKKLYSNALGKYVNEVRKLLGVRGSVDAHPGDRETAVRQPADKTSVCGGTQAGE